MVDLFFPLRPHVRLPLKATRAPAIDFYRQLEMERCRPSIRPLDPCLLTSSRD
jgi:hypothetical protein